MLYADIIYDACKRQIYMYATFYLRSQIKGNDQLLNMSSYLTFPGGISRKSLFKTSDSIFMYKRKILQECVFLNCLTRLINELKRRLTNIEHIDLIELYVWKVQWKKNSIRRRSLSLQHANFSTFIILWK